MNFLEWVGLGFLGYACWRGVNAIVDQVTRRMWIRAVMEGREPAPWEEAEWDRLVKVLRGPAFYDYEEDPARPFEVRF